MPQIILTAEQLLEFLSRIPLTSDPDDWVEHFKAVLCDLLYDVDRVSVFINFGYDLDNTDLDRISLIQEIGGKDDVKAANLCPDSPAEAAEYFQQLGEPVERYQKPIVLSFVVADGSRFASIYLWRVADFAPITNGTIRLLIRLGPLLALLFLGVIGRYVQQFPQNRTLTAGLARLAEDTGMTAKQTRILVHLLYGYSQKEAAERIGISLLSLKNSIRRLCKRAGVRTYVELNAKYFGPGLGSGGAAAM